MKAVKVVDAREACCLDTLATPIKEAVATIQPDQVLEVIVTPGFKRLFHRLAQEEQYSVLEEAEQVDGFHFRISPTKGGSVR